MKTLIFLQHKAITFLKESAVTEYLVLAIIRKHVNTHTHMKITHLPALPQSARGDHSTEVC